MTIPRGRVFATDGGARWGVCNTPLHGYPHQQTNGAQPPTNQHQTGPTGPNGWTPDMIIRPVPGRLVGRMQYAPTLPAGGPSGTRQTSPASADAPGQTWLASLTPPAKFAGVRRHPTANAERLALLAQTPRQMPRDLRCLRKRHGKCRETCAACANAAANAERPALPAQTPRQTPRDLRRLRTPSENTEQPLTVKILAYGKRQNIDAYRRHHQRD